MGRGQGSESLGRGVLGDLVGVGEGTGSHYDGQEQAPSVLSYLHRVQEPLPISLGGGRAHGPRTPQRVGLPPVAGLTPGLPQPLLQQTDAALFTARPSSFSGPPRGLSEPEVRGLVPPEGAREPALGSRVPNERFFSLQSFVYHQLYAGDTAAVNTRSLPSGTSSPHRQKQDTGAVRQEPWGSAGGRDSGWEGPPQEVKEGGS